MTTRRSPRRKMSPDSIARTGSCLGDGFAAYSLRASLSSVPFIRNILPINALSINPDSIASFPGPDVKHTKHLYSIVNECYGSQTSWPPRAASSAVASRWRLGRDCLNLVSLEVPTRLLSAVTSWEATCTPTGQASRRVDRQPLALLPKHSRPVLVQGRTGR